MQNANQISPRAKGGCDVTLCALFNAEEHEQLVLNVLLIPLVPILEFVCDCEPHS